MKDKRDTDSSKDMTVQGDITDEWLVEAYGKREVRQYHEFDHVQSASEAGISAAALSNCTDLRPI